MESITQILQSINSFSKQSFKFSQFIEPLLLLKKLPSDISYELNNDDFIFNLQQAFKHIDWLNDYFKNNINNLLIKEVSKLKNHKSKDTTIPYADFTVDKPPLFKKNLPVQLDFLSILNDSFNSGNPLKPVKRRNPDSFSFMGVCPFCGAPKEYIYDNNSGKGQYLLHYHYREFKFDLETLRKVDDTVSGPVNLSRIHYDQKVLGLVLTYYVNYGLSSRKTALILKQVHGLRISHQTVINYAGSVSAVIKPLIDKYPYKIGNTLSGDETYIKVRGKDNYVFFWSDPVNKIITSYKIYPVRDTLCACRSINDCLSKYQKIPDDLTLITDGNPIYNAAQVFFEINDIYFDLHQVIGVKNKDEESKKYRPFKQIEERLNRTYKQNYYGTNGYDRLECANSYMVLFVCFFNFLRQHSSLDFKTPVDDELFDDSMLMPERWLKLIELSSQYHIN